MVVVVVVVVVVVIVIVRLGRLGTCMSIRAFGREIGFLENSKMLTS